MRIDGKSLSEQLAAALRSNSIGDNLFASVTVEMIVQDRKEFTTSVNGEIFFPEEKTTETEETS